MRAEQARGPPEGSDRLAHRVLTWQVMHDHPANIGRRALRSTLEHGNARRGLTLIELMVTIAIIASVATFAVASSRPYRSQATSYYQVLSSEVTRVRSAALSTQRCYRLELSASQLVTKWADNDTCQANCTACTGTYTIERTYAAPPAVAIYEASATIDCSSDSNTTYPTTPFGATTTVDFANDGSTSQTVCVFVGTRTPPTRVIEGKSAFQIVAGTGKVNGSLWP